MWHSDDGRTGLTPRGGGSPAEYQRGPHRCAWNPPLLQEDLGFLLKEEGAVANGDFVADAEPRGNIYGPVWVGEKTEGESAHWVCTDGRRKARGKEEFYPVVRVSHVHGVRGMALNAGWSNFGTK